MMIDDMILFIHERHISCLVYYALSWSVLLFLKEESYTPQAAFLVMVL